MSGINLDKYKTKYNKDLLDNPNIDKLLKENKLVIKNGNIFINEKYIYLQNDLLIQLI